MSRFVDFLIRDGPKSIDGSSVVAQLTGMVVRTDGTQEIEGFITKTGDTMPTPFVEVTANGQRIFYAEWNDGGRGELAGDDDFFIETSFQVEEEVELCIDLGSA